MMTTIADLSTELIARKAEGAGFSGVISLAPLGSGASLDLVFGFADRANRIPNNVETRFAMASGSKAFTAMAVGSLIEDGRLALDTPLADCVRSRQFHFGSAVTIGQLLNHTSGVPDYFSEELQSDYAALWRDRPCYAMRSPRDFLPLFETGAMKAPPGSNFLYSNSGFILLGLVVEELTGLNFHDAIAERIFRPCGMTRSGYFAMDALPENTALGYIDDGENGWRTNIFSVPALGGGDGGAFTTAGDLRLFWTSLLAGRILGQDLLDRFLSPSVQVGERGETWHYGYGVWLRNGRKGRIVSIEGGDPGVSLESEVRLGEGLIVTVLSNNGADIVTMLDALIDSA